MQTSITLSQNETSMILQWHFGTQLLWYFLQTKLNGIEDALKNERASKVSGSERASRISGEQTSRAVSVSSATGNNRQTQA
jgi:hypothetical protein